MSKRLQPDKNRLGKLIEEGFELIPLHQAHAIGKNNKKLGKRPLNARWTTMELEKPIKLLHMMDEGHNLGVRLHETDEYWILVVDIDPRNFPLDGETDSNGKILTPRPDLALQAEFDIDLATYPKVLTGSYFPAKDPCTGEHIYMKARKPKDWQPGDKLAMYLPGYKGIDFKSVGGQVVAPGSVHPDFNRYYEWDDNVAIEDIGWAPDALVEALYKPHGQAGSQHWEGEADMTPEMLQQLLDQLVVEDFRDHEKWLQMMMACHAATNGQGINEFVAWSTGDPQFAHVGSDIAYRWETLDPNKSGGITYATLKKIAKDHNVKQMPLSPDEFADLSDEEQAEALASIPDTKHPLRDLNDEYFTAQEEGKFGIYSLTWRESLQRKTLLRYTKHDFLCQLADRPKIEVGKKVVPLAQAWLEWPGRNSFNNIEFLPERGDERIIEQPRDKGGRIYNTWSGFGASPVKKEGGWSYLDELIRTVLTSDEDGYNYVLDWMAHAIQYPGKPAEVALVFQGGKGTGKSTLGNIFANLFGQHGMKITSSELLTGRFNGHLEDVVGLFADEAFYAATGSHHSAEQMLKGLITESKMTFEKKGLTPRAGRNTLHIIMASNSDWVVPASVGERRFAIFLANDKRQQDIEFFAKLHEQMDEGGYEALLHDLQHRDITGWHPRNSIPRNNALLSQIEFGQGPVEGFLWEAIKYGDAAVWDPYLDDWSDGGCVEVLGADFESALRSWLKQFPGNRAYRDEVGRVAIGKKLGDVFGTRFEKKKLSKPPEGRLTTSSRPYAYKFPPLTEIRELWEKRLGITITWES